MQEGFNITNVSDLDEVEGEEGENVSYEELIEFDGSLNIYLSEEDEETVISRGI